jgi:hypothetical protein
MYYSRSVLCQTCVLVYRTMYRLALCLLVSRIAHVLTYRSKDYKVLVQKLRNFSPYDVIISRANVFQ